MLRSTILAAALTFLVPAHALAEMIQFNGTVDSTCTITVDSPGTLVPSANFSELSTANAGGAPGSASILATSDSFSVTVDSPDGFSAGPQSAEGAVFVTTYDLGGANTANGVSSSTTTALNYGTTDLSVNLSATHPTGIFETGTYQTEVTVLCE